MTHVINAGMTCLQSVASNGVIHIGGDRYLPHLADIVKEACPHRSAGRGSVNSEGKRESAPDNRTIQVMAQRIFGAPCNKQVLTPKTTLSHNTNAPPFESLSRDPSVE